MKDIYPSDVVPDEPRYSTAAHQERVRLLHRSYPLNDEETCDQNLVFIIDLIIKNASRKPSEAFLIGIGRAIKTILDSENIHASDYEPRNYREFLDADEQLFAAGDAVPLAATNNLATLFVHLIDEHAPLAISQEPNDSDTTIPLFQLMNDPVGFVGVLISFFKQAKYDNEHLTFPCLSRTLSANIFDASGYSLDDAKSGRILTFTHPSESDLPLLELIKAYLADTPFLKVLLMPVAFSIPDHIRFEHTHIIGGAGWGKSTLIAQTFLEDIRKPEPPCVIVIDPHSQLINELQRLAVFSGPLADRLIIINPDDSANPPALNMFDPMTKRFNMYSDDVRGQIENNTISLYAYIFGSIASALTQKQSVAFSFVVRLLFSIPGATIQTLLELMEEKAKSLSDSKFRAYIAQQNVTARRFFEHHFYHETEYKETKQQITARLYGILQYPEFDAMFSAKERKLDMFDAMQTGKIVLVNAARGRLGKEASALFGRYIIAQAFAAAFERGVAGKDMPPAYLIVDEAADFFDDQIETMLDTVRKFRLGLTFAHQRVEGQLSMAMRSALAANTSIKFAGGVSNADAYFMSKDMRCEPEFIADQRKDNGTTSFACYVRGYTERAVSLTIPLGGLDREPKMSTVAHEALIERNRERITVSARDIERPTPAHAPPPLTQKTPELPSAPDADLPQESGPKW